METFKKGMGSVFIYLALLTLAMGCGNKGAAPQPDDNPVKIEDKVLNGYHAVSTALAGDKYAQTKTEAGALIVVLDEAIKQAGQENPQYSYFIDMKEGAQKLSSTENEAELRRAMSTLSKGAVRYVKSQPALQEKWQAYMCPMVPEGEFNFWMQPKDEEMANPYMGLKMLKCGMKKSWDKVISEETPLDANKILDGYHAISTALANDKFEEVRSGAEDLILVLEEFIEKAGQEYPHYSQLVKMIKGAMRLFDAFEEEEFRLAMSTFAKGALSFVKSQPELQKDWQAYMCPMVPEGEFNFWMQPKDEEMMNPYMGLKMLQCGMKKSWDKVPDIEKPTIDVGKVLDGYLAISTALAGDKFLETKTEAKALVVVLEEVIEQVGQEYPQYSQLAQMKEGALRLSSTEVEAEQRLAMSTLAKGAVNLVKSQPELQKDWQAYMCPMVAEGEFNFWMQPKDEEMANPYMGLKMLKCGMKKSWDKVS